MQFTVNSLKEKKIIHALFVINETRVLFKEKLECNQNGILSQTMFFLGYYCTLRETMLQLGFQIPLFVMPPMLFWVQDHYLYVKQKQIAEARCKFMVTDFHVCLLLSPGCLLWSRLERMSFSFSWHLKSIWITRIVIVYFQSTV